jgi:prepilin-type N-terminal cleavage/methylation domain-containing protein
MRIDYPNLRARRLRAFTLTELLVVIAIIGILAGLIAGAITGARFKAQVTSCANNYRQWGIAANLYASEDPMGRLPSFKFPLAAAAAYLDVYPNMVSYDMPPKLQPYGLDAPLWFCPARNAGLDRVKEYLKITHPKRSGVTMEGLVEYWKTQKVDFAVIEHSWWVPRPLEGSEFMFPDPRVLKCRIPDGWPAKLDDSNGSAQPILSDPALARWNESRTQLETFGLGHQLLPRVLRNINLLFIDGRVETRTRSELKWQVEAARSGVFVY